MAFTQNYLQARLEVTFSSAELQAFNVAIFPFLKSG